MPSWPTWDKIKDSFWDFALNAFFAALMGVASGVALIMWAYWSGRPLGPWFFFLSGVVIALILVGVASAAALSFQSYRRRVMDRLKADAEQPEEKGNIDFWVDHERVSAEILVVINQLARELQKTTKDMDYYTRKRLAMNVPGRPLVSTAVQKLHAQNAKHFIKHARKLERIFASLEEIVTTMSVSTINYLRWAIQVEGPEQARSARQAIKRLRGIASTSRASQAGFLRMVDAMRGQSQAMNAASTKMHEVVAHGLAIFDRYDEVLAQSDAVLCESRNKKKRNGKS